MNVPMISTLATALTEVVGFSIKKVARPQPRRVMKQISTPEAYGPDCSF